MVECQFETTIKVVQSVGVGEFKPLCTSFEQFGIVYIQTYPHIVE